MKPKTIFHNGIDGQALAKQVHVKQFSKLDTRYWKDRLFRNSFTRNSMKYETTDWCVRIARNGRRETFNLETPNREHAAKKAHAIYGSLISSDWETTLKCFKPTDTTSSLVPGQDSHPNGPTVGLLIELSCRFSTRRPETNDAYTKAFRRIVAAIFKVSEGNKHDVVTGGRQKWIAEVNSISLAEVTPERVAEWKRQFLSSARTPLEQKRAIVTTNSLLRNAKALFNRRILPKLKQEMELPLHLPFDAITMEPEPSLRYRSKIDAENLLRTAKTDLEGPQPECFKLLLLTLVLGLRRSEADTLLWSQFDFRRKVLDVHDHDFKTLKSNDSGGEICLDEEVSLIFQRYHASSISEFVLAPSGDEWSASKPRRSRTYRSNATQIALIAWLRANGVTGLRPLHAMRKEIGSIIATRDGIWKASRYLRHSDIRITSRLYADVKAPTKAQLGGILG